MQIRYKRASMLHLAFECNLVILPSRSLTSTTSALLKSRAMTLHFALLLSILNSTISWSLQPMLPQTFTSPTCPSLFINVMSSRACPFIGSTITFHRKLSLIYSRNLLDCLCCLCCASSGHWDG